MPNLRQKILILYLANSALDSQVIAWTLYDGTGRERHTTGDSETPPYATGLEALQDGWRAIQFSRLMPPNTCRFYPSCSRYGFEAIRKHGAIKGSLLAGWRVLRCNPFNPGGFDPVP